MKESKRKILVVGQTPPPYHGQAIMIGKMLEATYEKIQLFHVRLSFSKRTNEIGRVNAFKLFHLLATIVKIIFYRVKYGADGLYYPPTGPNKVPFYRDAVILCVVRPFFRNTCFHFHAAGLSELYPRLGSLSQLLFRKAYYGADLGIRLSVNSSEDCKKLKVKKEYIIPYGIEDAYIVTQPSRRSTTQTTILFVGILIESKGVLTLIEACNTLKEQGVDFSVYVMGEFKSAEFEDMARALISEYGLNTHISFLGMLVGDDKFKVFQKSDIFCFPSFYEAESFPVVLLEASCFGLPVVSTDWRGIPSIVVDGENGFLVPVKEPVLVAEKLALLIADSELRIRMGRRARELYLEKYTLNTFYKNLEEAFLAM